MTEPRFRWQFPGEAASVDEATLAAGARHGLDDRVTRLLASRGVAGPAALDAFFGAPEAGLHDPSLLPDAGLFRDRIARARRDGERVLVFGDFDADGLTGLAIIVLTLRRLGVEAIPYVPSRLEEGHGLSEAAVAAAGTAGATVIVTVDCGTTSLPEIASARAAGIDVLVTDHHRIPPELPVAVAVVNPQRADSPYPERGLAGSGVAFKIAQLLLADEPGGRDAALDFADLATIGSIADLVPILGETRAIVRLGLERIRREPRPGIAALLAAAGVAASNVDVETLAFAVAPRINAAGRMGEAARRGPRCCSARPRGGDRARGGARDGQHEPARPDEDDDRRGAAIRRLATSRDRLDTTATPLHAAAGPGRPRSSAARGRSGSSGSSRRGSSTTSGGRRSSARSWDRSSGRRAGATARSTWAPRSSRARPCSSATAATPAPRASRSPTERWPEFVERFGALAATARPPDPRRAARDRPRPAGARHRLRPPPRASRGSRRAAPATRSRSSPSSA